MKNALTVMIALAAMLLANHQFAEAGGGGGGGAKKDAKIKVINHFSANIAIIVDYNGATLTNLQTLLSKGGKTASKNGSPITFTVNGGSHKISGYVIGPGGVLTNATSKTANVPKGKTLTITIKADGSQSATVN